MNASSVLLQYFDGNITKLQLSQSKPVSLFPGQIVSVTGSHLKKNLLAVEDIVNDASPNLSTDNPDIKGE